MHLRLSPKLGTNVQVLPRGRSASMARLPQTRGPGSQPDLHPPRKSCGFSCSWSSAAAFTRVGGTAEHWGAEEEAAWGLQGSRHCNSRSGRPGVEPEFQAPQAVPLHRNGRPLWVLRSGCALTSPGPGTQTKRARRGLRLGCGPCARPCRPCSVPVPVDIGWGEPTPVNRPSGRSADRAGLLAWGAELRTLTFALLSGGLG